MKEEVTSTTAHSRKEEAFSAGISRLLGVDISRMRTVSYGEDRPEVPNAQSESAHQLNRRAHLIEHPEINKLI